LVYVTVSMEYLLQDIDSNFDINNISLPLRLKNKILMSPGLWNDNFYGNEEIKKAYVNTDWTNKDARSLFWDHMDGSPDETGMPRPGAKNWIGEVDNPHMDGENLVGDLLIVDRDAAIKLAYGAKLGISPKVSGEENEEGILYDFLYNNFSVVAIPAVKTAYINNSQKAEGEKNLKKNKNMNDSKIEIVTPGLVDINPGYKYFVDDTGNICRMKEETMAKKEEIEENKEVKEDETVEKTEDTEESTDSETETSEDAGKAEESDESKDEGLSDEKSTSSEMKEKKSQDEEVVDDKKKEKKKVFPPEDKEASELSEKELLDIVSTPGWTDFVETVRKENADWSLPKIAAAFKTSKAAEMGDTVEALKTKTEGLEETIQKLSEQIKELKEAPKETKEMSARPKEVTNEDVNRDFLEFLKKGAGVV